MGAICSAKEKEIQNATLFSGYSQFRHDSSLVVRLEAVKHSGQEAILIAIPPQKHLQPILRFYRLLCEQKKNLARDIVLVVGEIASIPPLKLIYQHFGVNIQQALKIQLESETKDFSVELIPSKFSPFRLFTVLF